jgi:predicted enzyme related to lactoylglutathione lyase
MPRVIRFEINADPPERAVKSYFEVFGWKNTKMKSTHRFLARLYGGENQALMEIMKASSAVTVLSTESDDKLTLIKTGGFLRCSF